MAAEASPPSSAAPTPNEPDQGSLSSSALDEGRSPSSSAALAVAAARIVAGAEAPLRWAPPRERRALRGLPSGKAMRREQLEGALETAFVRSPALREELGGTALSLSLSLPWSSREKQTQTQRETLRCLAAALRSAAFLAVGDFEQALKDARVAAARAAPPLRAAASALLASALEASGDKNSEALLEWLRCLSSSNSSNSEMGAKRRGEAEAAVERLRRRVPARHAAAAAAGSGDFARAALALSSCLAREAQDSLPEVMRPRPKYYHYFKWTTKRIKAANGGSLPPPEVLRLLLASPAGDLDDVLSHPTAAAAAVARLTSAFEHGGMKALEASPLPRLTWREMREVQAWREGREVEGDEEVKALEGGGGGGEEQEQQERRAKEPLPPPQPAAADDDEGNSGSESELDLDALDF